MPKYKKKITRLMDYEEFNASCEGLPIARRAFLDILFFTGCRVSEVLALTTDDVSCTSKTVFIQFFRLKGSKQTDPQEIPRTAWIGAFVCDPSKEGKLFNFSRSTAYRIVKRIFPELYPHYFRLNRITKTVAQFGDATAYQVFGITASAIDHYRGKVDIKRVGRALRDELT